MAVNPALQAYADAVNAKYDTMGTDVDTLVTSLTGISADEKFLKDTIAQLQNNPGTFSPEDQALVDALQARVDAMGTKIGAAKDTAASLDAATEEPPTPTP
jgi:outer membrane murein-binding lipoprotein Lpp